MSAPVLRSTATRRSLYCLLSRRTRADYSQSALSSVIPRVQGHKVSSSLTSDERARTSNQYDCFQAVTNNKNPLEPNQLDRYLASTGGVDLEPTLDDIERCKPQSFSRQDSPRYAAEYKDVLETLCRSFSKDQLRRFTELYKLDPIWTRSTRRKTEYAESIIEKAWGWPSLKEIERKLRDTTEVLIKSFAVTPSQLFLIMGKDGADLLQLSTQYNVHISLTSSPLALRVEGLRGSLKGLTEHISSLKKGIIEKIFELPSGRPVHLDLLQRISRLSGAYVENHGNRGKVRVCAKDIGDIMTAEKLALRSSLEIAIRRRTVCYDSPGKIRGSPIEVSIPQRYALYPFSTPYSLPWTMHSGGAFRLRRVADWLGVNRYEDIVSMDGLTDNPHRLLNLNRGGEELSRLVCTPFPENTLYCRRTIIASPGHILISPGGSSQRDAIFPPLKNALCLPDILEWLETSGTPLTFVPSISPAMMTITAGRSLHRLVYRTLPQGADQVSNPPQHVLKFEIEPSRPPPTTAPSTQCFENASKRSNTLSSKLDWSTNPQSSGASAPQLNHLSGMMNNGWGTNCQVGTEVYVNLMLPDRPMDMQLCVFDCKSISLISQPRALREYANKLYDLLAKEAQLPPPDPPLTFSFEGRTYYFHESLNVKQSNNSDFLSPVSHDCHADIVAISSESINDLQSTQKMELCQVMFNGVTEGLGWRRFLATCDQLTAASLESHSKKDQPVHLEE